MMKSNIKSKKGFTIIEVVLVLAVAGLIFLMAFVALPSMQRGQRDTQRRSDMSRFLSQLSAYQANNNGKLPHIVGAANAGSYEQFIKDYITDLNDSFEDPSTRKTYSIVYQGNDHKKFTEEDNDGNKLGVINLYTSATCNGETVEEARGSNMIAIKIKLEGAGYYCGHN